MDEKKYLKPQSAPVLQNVILENREKMNISGVSDVESFDEGSVVLYTELGTLIIKGEALKMNHLNIENGEVAIEGYVHSCTYQDGYSKKRGRGSWLGSLFK